MIFPADVYGIVLNFQELQLIRIGDFSVFAIRGYATAPKEVEKIMGHNAKQFAITDNSDNFSVETVREIDNQWQCYDFLNTPIFSCLIIPKGLNISASTSKALLFAYNLDMSEKRIIRAEFEITNGPDDTDNICEKSNTLRRVMENMLKIECCYRYKQMKVKESYSNLLLGDLIKLVRNFRNDEEKLNLNSIVRLANELSHDSGKPVTKEKALELLALVKEYLRVLASEIASNPYPHFDFLT